MRPQPSPTLFPYTTLFRSRPRERADGTGVSAFLWTSLVEDAPRIMVNVENDDYGEVLADVACDCALGRLGLTTRMRGIRGLKIGRAQSELQSQSNLVCRLL